VALSSPDIDRRSSSFKVAYRKIGNLLERLNDKRVCPCCSSQALMLHAVCWTEHFLGSAKAIELLEECIVNMRKNNIPAPDRVPSAEMH
jgi:hypothetical protein